MHTCTYNFPTNLLHLIQPTPLTHLLLSTVDQRKGRTLDWKTYVHSGESKLVLYTHMNIAMELTFLLKHHVLFSFLLVFIGVCHAAVAEKHKTVWKSSGHCALKLYQLSLSIGRLMGQYCRSLLPDSTAPFWSCYGSVSPLPPTPLS